MPNAQVRADVFPARLSLIDSNEQETVYTDVRVILTLDHVYVIKDGSPFETVFDDRLTTYTPPIPATRVRSADQLLDRSAKFTTEDGLSGSFIRGGGCGCGSRLKRAPVDTLLPNATISQAASSNDSIA